MWLRARMGGLKTDPIFRVARETRVGIAVVSSLAPIKSFEKRPMPVRGELRVGHRRHLLRCPIGRDVIQLTTSAFIHYLGRC